MIKRFSFLLVTLCLVIGAGVLIGCGDLDEGIIEGTWVHPGDSYVITATTLQYVSMWEGTDYGYKAERISLRPDGSRAGYITVRFTEHLFNPALVEDYFVIHYKDLTSTSVQMAGAYKAGGEDSMPSAAAAEAEFTVPNGYFAMYGTYTRE